MVLSIFGIVLHFYRGLLRFLTTTAALTLVIPGCLLGATGSLDGLADRTLAGSHGEKTACCWCIHKWSGDNEVRDYLGFNHCEGRDSIQYRGCRRVEVAGNSCAFVTLSKTGGTVNCLENDLYAWIGEGKVKIRSPEFSVCAARTLFPQAVSVRGGNEEGICRCGLDPSNNKRCLAARQEAGEELHTESVPVNELDPDCSHTCKEMLSTSAAFETCSRVNKF